MDNGDLLRKEVNDQEHQALNEVITWQGEDMEGKDQAVD